MWISHCCSGHRRCTGTQRCYGELAELTADDIWQIVDAGDQELQRLTHSSRRGIFELGAKDNDDDNDDNDDDDDDDDVDYSNNPTI